LRLLPQAQVRTQQAAAKAAAAAVVEGERDEGLFK
jgi:hypothetical protein